MRTLIAVLLLIAGVLLAGCGQSSEDYSSELSSEVPKAREGSPEFDPIKPEARPGGPTRAGK